MGKNKVSIKVWFYFLIGTPVLVTAFQNCGQLFDDPVVKFDEVSLASSNSLILTTGCETQIMEQYDALFRSTYYPYLTSNQNCTNCHSGSGPGIGSFGYPDVTISGLNFISRFEKINQNARSSSHANGLTGTTDDIIAINSFEPQWTNAITAYKECTNQAISGKGIITTTKSAASMNTTANTSTAHTTHTWNLESEILSTSARGRIPVTFTVEARVAVIGGVRRGYEFRNPSVRLNSATGTSFRFSGIKIYINNIYMSEVTTYSTVDSTVSTTTPLNLAAGYSSALAVTSTAPSGTDVISLEFGTIRDGSGAVIDPGTVVMPTPTVPTPNPVPTPTPTPTPTPVPTTVTLAQLLGTDTRVNVFAASCVGCHNSTTAFGGLNLTNAAQAKANATEILNRMNNAGSPMPTSGLLPQARRDIVNAWVMSGAN